LPEDHVRAEALLGHAIGKSRVSTTGLVIAHQGNILMSRVVVRSFAMSIDGYNAGPNQSLDDPLGVNGPELMDWFFHTRVWREMHQQPDRRDPSPC
jgi:hypothetical protein